MADILQIGIEENNLPLEEAVQQTKRPVVHVVDLAPGKEVP
jgi:hypothetical protein